MKNNPVKSSNKDSNLKWKEARFPKSVKKPTQIWKNCWTRWKPLIDRSIQRWSKQTLSSNEVSQLQQAKKATQNLWWQFQPLHQRKVKYPKQYNFLKIYSYLMRQKYQLHQRIWDPHSHQRSSKKHDRSLKTTKQQGLMEFMQNTWKMDRTNYLRTYL